MDNILSRKVALLDSPGTKYNDLYYSAMNSTVSLIEETFKTGSNALSLSSLNFNSTSQVNIPNDNFIGTTWLNLVLPNTVADQTLPRGWGYACIDTITYTVGASSSQFTIDGNSLLALAMSGCKNKEQKDELIRQAGQELLVPLVAPVGEDLPTNEATILLPLPWSSMCEERLPFDTSILSSNIVINIKFRDARSIYGGTAAPSTQFTSASVFYREGVLTDRSKSLKWDMMSDPSLILNYPFVHSQNTSGIVAGRRVSEGLRQTRFQLQGFINSDILGMYFILRRNEDVSPSTNAARNPNVYRDFINPRLLFNGNILYDAPGKSWKVANMTGNQSASYYFTSDISQASTVSPFTSLPTDAYVLYVDFSRIRSQCMPDHLFNVSRISNQNLEFQFNTPTSETYRIDCTYIYNGLIAIKNQTSEIILS